LQASQFDPDYTFPDVYFQTLFAAEEPVDDWPREFAIITVWATTGESWSVDRNRQADQQLHADLAARVAWLKRITGQSPDGRHAEPGWAVAIDFDSACDTGSRYRQPVPATGNLFCLAGQPVRQFL